MQNNKINLSPNYFISILMILVGIIFFIFLDINRQTFEYDEIFTIAMVKQSFQSIWYITGTDVHPPLYYFMLKCFTLIFNDSAFALRFFSALGIISTLLIGLFYIRKYFGEKISLLFIIIITILPVNQYLVTEVRMYSWTMFFIFLCSLSAYRVSTNNRYINYIALLFFSLCSAYTHYFGLLGVLIIFTILMLWLIYHQQNKVKLIATFFIFIACYSLWIPKFIAQITKVNIQYWIGKPTAKDLLLLTYYSFSPKEPSHSYTIFNLEEMSIALSIMLIMIGFIIIYLFFNLKNLNQKKRNTAFLFIISAILPIALSLSYSYIVKPILVPRYLTCYLGCIVLGISILFSEMYKTRLQKVLVSASIAMLFILSSARVFSEKRYNEIQIEELSTLKDFFKANTSSKLTFIAPRYSSIELAKLEFFFPNNLYLMYSDKKTNYTNLPFKSIEVNELPHDFDFYLLVSNNNFVKQLNETRDFRNNISKDYVITDSLIQTDRKIYRMRTIHRERESFK